LAGIPTRKTLRKPWQSSRQPCPAFDGAWVNVRLGRMHHAQWTRLATGSRTDFTATLGAGHQAKRSAMSWGRRWNFSGQADAVRKALRGVDAVNTAERVNQWSAGIPTRKTWRRWWQRLRQPCPGFGGWWVNARSGRMPHAQWTGRDVRQTFSKA